MAHAREWIVLTREERDACSHAIVPNADYELIGVGIATLQRAVSGKPIPKVAAALCRHWLQKNDDERTVNLRKSVRP